jgi:copper chaperone CopZ
MKELKLKVDGMDCTACERRLETALSRVQGVVRSKADYQQGSVSVVTDPSKAIEDSIRATIQKAGFGVSW